jgi:hypothetical protein
MLPDLAGPRLKFGEPDRARRSGREGTVEIDDEEWTLDLDVEALRFGCETDTEVAGAGAGERGVRLFSSSLFSAD